MASRTLSTMGIWACSSGSMGGRWALYSSKSSSRKVGPRVSKVTAMCVGEYSRMVAMRFRRKPYAPWVC